MTPTRHYALIALLIAVPISAWVICYKPMNVAVHDAADEIRIRTGLLLSYAEINRQHRVVKSISDSIKQVQADAAARIPEEQDAQQWLESASDAAVNLGLRVQSVTTSGERDNGDYRILPVDLHVSGEFEGVYKLLQHLERMNRMSRIDRLTVHREDDNHVDARIVVHLVFASGTEE